MQQREGLPSGVVVFGDVQEAEGHSTAEQETADHTQWDKEGKLVTIDPARRRDGKAKVLSKKCFKFKTLLSEVILSFISTSPN